jgi:protease I
VLISDGFEQSELDGPVQELKRLGAQVEILGQNQEQLTHGIQGMKSLGLAGTVKPQQLVNTAEPDDYDGLLIPGGAMSADYMRASRIHLTFLRNFMDAEKPVAAICHGPWLLADAGVAQGRTLTSWPAIHKDLERAGGIWKDEEVIQDGNLITSRNPDDVPVFTRVFAVALEEYASRRSPRSAAAA